MLNRLRSVVRFQESGLVLVVLALGVLLTVFSGTVRTPKFERTPEGERRRVFTTDEAGERTPAFVEKNKFLNAQSLAQLAKDTSFIAIMAVGMAVVIIAGGIDLSVGSIYAIASVLGAVVFQYYGPDGPGAGTSQAVGIFMGCATCLGVALLCGLFNGGLTVALKVHPFIITLGAMAIFRGAAFVVSKGNSIGGFPSQFQEFVLFKVGDNLSVVPALVMIIALVAGWIFLARLASGRRVYAIGGNELAARFSGIRVEKVKLGVYLISALSAGIAALVAIGYYGSASSGDGTGKELNVIAAAVVGGTSLTGGRGSALGVVLGALLIQMIDTGIVVLEINQNYSQIVIGAVIIAAVALDSFNTRLAERRLAAGAKAKP